MIRATTVLAVAGALLLAGCSRGEPDGIALTGATVIDGTDAAPRPNMVVVVRRQRIETIEPADGFTLPPRTVEVDVRGRWIIPGLVDAHVHVADWTLPRFLAFGVTSVRDMHGNLEGLVRLRGVLNDGRRPGPRLYIAGSMIDGSPPTYPDAIAVTDGDSARRAVDALAVAGVDFVKGYTRLTPTVLQELVDEAQVFGLRVSAHLGLTDAVTAARLGLRGLEHLSGIPEAAGNPEPLYAAHRESFFAGWNAFERAWTTADSTALARVARELAAAKVVVTPTLVLHEVFSRLDDSASAGDPDLQWVPAAEIDRWDVPDLVRRAGWTAGDFAAFRAARPRQDLFVRAFRAAGGTLAAGSDAANQRLVPGASLHRELELLVAAGLSPAEALRSATSAAAQLLGADSLGILVPGRLADLVVLSADPLADIRNTRQVERVLVRGRLLDADSLRRTLR